MTAADEATNADPLPGPLATPVVLLLWLASLFLLLITIGNPPITRAQEARVLETARQMLGTGTQGWLSPTLNGEPRLKKPPLCYWMTAVAYQIGGVSEGIGRIPTAILGWLTLGVTYLLTRKLFDQRTAIFSATALLGSMYFYRFSRLAETDPAATFFLTLSIYFIWKSSTSRNLLWPHLIAIAAAMVVLTKGAPAIFILLFLLGWCAVESKWDVAKRFLISGAPLTLAALAIPWFYVGGAAAASEMKNNLSGGDHFAGPWVYIPWIFAAVAPWSGFLPLALWNALKKWKTDAAIRFVSLWFGSIFIPLCITGNKQSHYLVMLMPPTMILIGRLLALADVEWKNCNRLVLIGTTLILLALGIYGPVAASGNRGNAIPLDWISGSTIGVGVLIVWWRMRSGLGSAIAAMLVIVTGMMPLILGLWLPSIEPHNARDSASEIRQVFPNSKFIFLGDNPSFTLCFYLREIIPTARTNDELLARSAPGLVAIAVTDTKLPPPRLPAPFALRLRVEESKQSLALYEYGAP